MTKKADHHAKAAVEASVEEEHVGEIISIDQAAWTSQDSGVLVIDLPEQWPTQDYEKNPPAPVLWERPFDSI